jgi:hypothetical protein
MTTLILLALGSIVFFSTIMIVMALMLRSRWDKLSPDDPSRLSHPSHPPGPSHPSRPSQSSHRRE